MAIDGHLCDFHLKQGDCIQLAGSVVNQIVLHASFVTKYNSVVIQV